MNGSANRSRADAKWRNGLEESVALGLLLVGVATRLAGAIGAH